tara:strand:+ start:1089 stop:1286 length:198 start_codon:yes stop_codon:yes gene_type:complete
MESSKLMKLKKKISKRENDDLINELKELWKITETSLIGKVIKKEGNFFLILFIFCRPLGQYFEIF